MSNLVKKSAILEIGRSDKNYGLYHLFSYLKLVAHIYKYIKLHGFSRGRIQVYVFHCNLLSINLTRPIKNKSQLAGRQDIT